MRVIRVLYKGRTFYASLIEGQVYCLDRKLGFNDPIQLNQVQVLPVVMPTKIICVGLNYKAHAEELNKPIPKEPILFLKPPSAIISTGQPIILPNQSSRVDFEGELGLVLGKVCRNAKPEDALEHVFGYICANDVTARDLQEKDGYNGRAKGFDTFAPLGPWIETQVEDPLSLTVTAKLNDEIRQNSPVADMIFPPDQLISFISQIMTLLPGDVILTGTPPGIGSLSEGDTVEVDIPNVGILKNNVVREGQSPGNTLQ